MFQEVERRLKYKWWDKQRERSNRAKGFMEGGAVAVKCVMRHDTIAYSGPPNDAIRAYVCLYCHGAACEPEIKDKGFDFETVPDWIIYQIMNLDLERQARGKPSSFGMYTGKGGFGGVSEEGGKGHNAWFG